MKYVPIAKICIILATMWCLLGIPLSIYAVGQKGSVTMQVRQNMPVTAGDTATILVHINESDFSYSHCTCTISITKSNKLVFFDHMLSASDHLLSIQYTFPTTGIYDIHFSGTSPSDVHFTTLTGDQMYTVTQAVTLDQQKTTSSGQERHMQNTVFAWVAFVGFFLFIGIYPLLKKINML